MSSKQFLISKNNKKKYFSIFYSIAFIYGFFCILISGPAWDSFFYLNLGKDRLNYLLSLGINKVDYNYYEQIFIGTYLTIAAFIVNIFPKTFEIEALYTVNLLSSIFTTIGVYKLIKILFKKEIGYLTAVIFLSYSIFFGHAQINDRDTISVMCNVWIVYYVFKYFEFNLKKNKKYVIYISIFMAIGLGVRFHFIATLIPILLFISFNFVQLERKLKKIFLKDLLKIIIITFLIIFVFWVPTHENLLTKPFEILTILFERSYGWGLVMINGQIYESNNYPITYIFQNLFFKSPEYVIFLYILFMPIFFPIKKILNNKNFNRNIFFIILNVITPTFLLFIFDTNVYDGLRLFLYILPYFLTIPAIVLYFLILNRNKVFFKGCLIISIFLFIFYVYNFFSITPYHYTYLNIFAGKFSNADTKFENDYWGISLKELSKKMVENDEINNLNFVKFSICGVSKYTFKYNLDNIKPKINYKIVNDKEKPDFVVMTNRLIKVEGKNKKKYSTCFQKYKGESIVSVERRNLKLSSIKIFKY